MTWYNPDAASHGVCATVMPSSDHTATSTSSAMVPTNLRVRILMTEMRGAGAARLGPGEAADYKVHANSHKTQGFDERGFRAFHAAAGGALVARRRCGADRGHGAGRRCHAAD